MTENVISRASVTSQIAEDPAENRPTFAVRTPARIRVLMYASGNDGQPIYAEGETVKVHVTGALVAAAPPLAIGQSVLLIDAKSGKEKPCIVRSTTLDEAGTSLADLEFAEPAPDFWRVKLLSAADAAATLDDL